MAKQRKISIHFSISEFLFLIFFWYSSIMLAFSSKSFVLRFDEIGFSILTYVQDKIFFVKSKMNDVVLLVQETTQLRQDNEVLKERLKNYEYMQRNNSDIRKENERLRVLLDYSESLVQKNYPAEIIGRDTDSLYSYIIINKGSKHGIRKNLPVIAYQNGNTGIVGKVTSVGYATSQIMPVYNIHCAVSARIKNTRDIGIVVGSGNANSPLRMQYIKKRVLDELRHGDVVVSSGENDNYIKDIPIGTIDEIVVVDYDSSLDIKLTPAIDFSRLEDVIVINLKELRNSPGD